MHWFLRTLLININHSVSEMWLWVQPNCEGPRVLTHVWGGSLKDALWCPTLVTGPTRKPATISQTGSRSLLCTMWGEWVGALDDAQLVMALSSKLLTLSSSIFSATSWFCPFNEFYRWIAWKILRGWSDQKGEHNHLISVGWLGPSPLGRYKIKQHLHLLST